MYTKEDVCNTLHSMMINELLNGTRFNGNNIDVKYIDGFIQRLFNGITKHDIDEKKINEFTINYNGPLVSEDDYYVIDIENAYKSGYRKAKEK